MPVHLYSVSFSSSDGIYGWGEWFGVLFAQGGVSYLNEQFREKHKFDARK